jgi:hypothetical protein
VKKKIIAILIATALVVTGLVALPVMAAPATGTMTHIQLTPNDVSMVTGTTQQFTAQALDANNQPVANVTYLWLVAPEAGTIDTTGLFKAGSVGTYDDAVKVVVAQGTTVKIAAAKVTVVASMGVLDHIKVMPATANVLPSGTQQFTAQGYDVNGVAIPNLNYTWTGTGTVGTLSNTGLFTAGTATGTYTVQANGQGTTTPTGTATVNVTTTPAPTTTPSENHGKSCLFNVFKHYLKNIGSDNFLGGQWQVKNASGAIDTYKIISGVVQTASATSLTIIPNGQTAVSTFTLTTSTVIQPKNTVLAATDKVIIITINDQVTMVTKISAASDTTTPPGLNKHDDNRQGKGMPSGWSHGKKTGWDKNSSDSGNGSNVDGN